MPLVSRPKYFIHFRIIFVKEISKLFDLHFLFLVRGGQEKNNVVRLVN